MSSRDWDRSSASSTQPLNYYLKEVQGWTPVQVTAFVTVFNVPWIIKPVYGLISDFVPLFGYRRKSYLIIANIAAVAGYFWVTRLTAPSDLALALMLTAYAMAISSTLCGAVLVENGQKHEQCGKFVNQQWLWYNIAAMAAAILGGELVQYLDPSFGAAYRRRHRRGRALRRHLRHGVSDSGEESRRQRRGHEGHARAAWHRRSSGGICGSSPFLSFSIISVPA